MNKILLSAIIAVFCCTFAFAQESKPLKITERPKPEAPLDAGMLDAQGTFSFRITFLANGEIGTVSQISDFPVKILIENAVKAIKKIKFEPQIEENSLINLTAIVQYSYSWEYGWKNIPSKFEDNKQDKQKLDEKAEAIIKKAVQNLGGDKYLQAQSQIGRGRFTQLREGAVASSQSFVDVVVFPDKERTEFKNGGLKTVQTNVGNSGWIYDGASEVIKDQTAKQIAEYKLATRVSLDNLLRGAWRGDGSLSYAGKRQGTLGKRNDVVKLGFPDGFSIEFEFDDEGLPVKAIYKQTKSENVETKEEDRYAQFADVNGIKTPFIVDRFTDNAQSSRINYESVEFNKKINDAVFAKPKDVKEGRKDVKF